MQGILGKWFGNWSVARVEFIWILMDKCKSCLLNKLWKLHAAQHNKHSKTHRKRVQNIPYWFEFFLMNGTKSTLDQMFIVYPLNSERERENLTYEWNLPVVATIADIANKLKVIGRYAVANESALKLKYLFRRTMRFNLSAVTGIISNEFYLEHNIWVHPLIQLCSI